MDDIFCYKLFKQNEHKRSKLLQWNIFQPEGNNILRTLKGWLWKLIFGTLINDIYQTGHNCSFPIVQN